MVAIFFNSNNDTLIPRDYYDVFLTFRMPDKFITTEINKYPKIINEIALNFHTTSKTTDIRINKYLSQFDCQLKLLNLSARSGISATSSSEKTKAITTKLFVPRIQVSKNSICVSAGRDVMNNAFAGVGSPIKMSV